MGIGGWGAVGGGRDPAPGRVHVVVGTATAHPHTACVTHPAVHTIHLVYHTGLGVRNCKIVLVIVIVVAYWLLSVYGPSMARMQGGASAARYSTAHLGLPAWGGVCGSGGSLVQLLADAPAVVRQAVQADVAPQVHQNVPLVGLVAQEGRDAVVLRGLEAGDDEVLRRWVRCGVGWGAVCVWGGAHRGQGGRSLGSHTFIKHTGTECCRGRQLAAAARGIGLA